MNCPFLRETWVRYCRRAAVPKPIPHWQRLAEERCTTPAYRECPLYRQQHEAAPDASRCPLLHESLVQYCSGAAVTKFIPYSETLLSRCGNGSFPYCDLYTELAGPQWDAVTAGDSIPVRQGAFYTRNHLWLDLSGDGPCHLGIDAFLARMLGSVDAIGYLSKLEFARPAAVLTAGGVDFQVVFPEKILLTACNLYLRSEPSRLTAEPYAYGWLFEGHVDPANRTRLEAKLVDAKAARTWMDRETRRMNEWLHTQRGDLRGDGGLFVEGQLAKLPRENALRLFHEFCPPAADIEEEIK